MADGGVSRNIPLRRFANACWSLLQALTYDAVIEVIVDAARDLAGVDGAFFAGREGTELRIIRSSGLSNPDMARSWRLPVGEGVTGWVVAHGAPAVVRDWTEDPRRVQSVTSIVDAEGVRSAAVLPVRSGTQVIGALGLLQRSLVEPEQWPMEALELLVRQAVSQLNVAMAVQSERLARTVAESAAEELHSVEEITGLVARAVAGDRRLSAGLQAIVECLGGTAVLVGADGTVLRRAGAVEPTAAGAAPLPIQAEVDVEDGSTVLGQLRYLRRKPLQPHEHRALTQCATVIALQLLRERSVLETEERLGRDLFHELLLGHLPDQDSLRYRASLLGIDLGTTRALFRVGLHTGSEQRRAAAGLAEADLRSLENSARNLVKAAVGWISETDVVLVLDVPDLPEREVREVGGQLLRAASSAMGKSLAAGLGRPCSAVPDYGRAAAEAQMALEIARARTVPDEVVTRDELGICALLGTSTDPEELIDTVMRLLAPLLAADEQSGSEYVHTLRVFLRHRHIAKAAERLHVHVNTLRHRLRKIEELLDIDLDDPNRRFMLELALRVHETVRPGGRGPDGWKGGAPSDRWFLGPGPFPSVKSA